MSACVSHMQRYNNNKYAIPCSRDLDTKANVPFKSMLTSLISSHLTNNSRLGKLVHDYNRFKFLIIFT